MGALMLSAFDQWVTWKVKLPDGVPPEEVAQIAQKKAGLSVFVPEHGRFSGGLEICMRGTKNTIDGILIRMLQRYRVAMNYVDDPDVSFPNWSLWGQPLESTIQNALGDIMSDEIASAHVQYITRWPPSCRMKLRISAATQAEFNTAMEEIRRKAMHQGIILSHPHIGGSENDKSDEYREVRATKRK